MAPFRSVSDADMKRFAEGTAEADDADHKKVDRAGHAGGAPDLCPGFLHFTAPVDVVEYEDGRLAGPFHALAEISHGGFIAVVTVEKYQVRGHCFQGQGQGLVEITADRADIVQPEAADIGFGCTEDGGSAFQGQQ